MPWVTKVTRSRGHRCRRPMILWRRIGSIWQCPRCRDRWIIGEPGYSTQHLEGKVWLYLDNGRPAGWADEELEDPADATT